MWALAFGVFVLCCCALVYLRNWIVTRLNRFGERSRQGHYWKLAAELVGDTSVVLLALLALVITAHSVLATSPAVLEKLVIVGFLLQTGLWGVSAINFWVDGGRASSHHHDPRA